MAGRRNNPAAFWRYVVRTRTGKGCWLWTGAHQDRGYGFFTIGGRTWGSHRYAWALAHRRHPTPGMVIAHHCDTPACVNPAHLYLATPQQNSHDARDRGRLRIHRGTAHVNARLTAEAVRDIWRSMAAGSATMGQLAQRYGVSKGLVQQVREGRAWRWLTRDLPPLPTTLPIAAVARRADATHTNLKSA